MRQILLKIKYLGTNYHGWQVQDNAVTVQERLQDAVEEILGQRLDLTGCSRTDAGVHANEYCCTIKTESDVDCFKLQGGLNAKLPDDISVFSVSDVDLDFHPRYSCVKKQYVYKILNSRAKDPFLNGRALLYPQPLDVELLDRCAKDFIGTHDFTALSGSKCELEDCTRTIFDASVERDGDLVTFSVTGDGFLYNMVRIMVGTLLFINEGKIKPDGIRIILDKKDRAAAGRTAPAHGLYLNKVYYGGDANE
ncbi:MAG: tRNA pseudouridine(38-40) synthase TruA [Clostridia bacterium]|nr:tRNA pseudouridine(38-40) synthase TruA [Clostridia bacterium]